MASAETWSNTDINGPWDMTALVTHSGADLFVANALSRSAGFAETPPVGLCTVVRIDVSIVGGQMPRMLRLHRHWIPLRVAGEQGRPHPVANRRGARQEWHALCGGDREQPHHEDPDAVTRSTAIAAGTDTLSSGGALNGPLGLTMAPDGDLVALNGNDGNAVEVSPQGRQVAKVTLVAHGAGDLFGASG